MDSVIVVGLANLSYSCQHLRSLCERDKKLRLKDSSLRINFVPEPCDQTQPGPLSLSPSHSVGTGSREPWE